MYLLVALNQGDTLEDQDFHFPIRKRTKRKKNQSKGRIGLWGHPTFWQQKHNQSDWCIKKASREGGRRGDIVISWYEWIKKGDNNMDIMGKLVECSLFLISALSNGFGHWSVFKFKKFDNFDVLLFAGVILIINKDLQ